VVVLNNTRVFPSKRSAAWSAALLQSGRPGLAVLAAFEAGVVGRGERLDGRPRALLFNHEGAERHACVTHLAPEFAPRVANVPVGHAGVGLAPARDRDDVVHALALRADDPARVVQERHRVDAAANGAAGHDLLLHGVRQTTNFL